MSLAILRALATPTALVVHRNLHTWTQGRRRLIIIAINETNYLSSSSSFLSSSLFYPTPFPLKISQEVCGTLLASQAGSRAEPRLQTLFVHILGFQDASRGNVFSILCAIQMKVCCCYGPLLVPVLKNLTRRCAAPLTGATPGRPPRPPPALLYYATV